VIHLKTVRLGAIDDQRAARFPFNVPAIRALAGSEISLSSEITFLVGENGSGKSTFLEALACAAGSITVGSESVEGDRTLSHVRELARTFKLSWSKRARRGFFMRSEDFFGFTKQLRATREEMERELEAIEESYARHSDFARSLARMPYLRELADMRRRYGEDLDARSHGESYFTLFASRFVPNGLYLLDEPEAPLSPMRQIGLLSMLKTMVEDQGAQFIIATHSPLLMAFPGAMIYSFDAEVMRPIAYHEVEHVTVMKAFLNNPERFLRHI
jgi:predicted ATPase